MFIKSEKIEVFSQKKKLPDLTGKIIMIRIKKYDRIGNNSNFFLKEL